MKKPFQIAIEKLREEPFASVICYPRPNEAELGKRIRELEELRIKALKFSGEKEVFNLPILGKGYMGIVVVVYRNREKLALKIRRVDADRSGMQREAKMLRKANSIDVGPRLLGTSENFLLMQLIDGTLFPEWLRKRRGKDVLKRILHEILEQCWRLDNAGLDHGELSHAPKHIIIGRNDMPFFVDFETASINRRPSNVTSICQYLFISGLVAKKIAEKLDKKDEKLLVKALRHYKNDRTRRNFEKVLRTCDI